MMSLINWPPDFDGFKKEAGLTLGRVKDTEIWIELDLNDPFWIAHLKSLGIYPTLLSWVE